MVASKAFKALKKRLRKINRRTPISTWEGPEKRLISIRDFNWMEEKIKEQHLRIEELERPTLDKTFYCKNCRQAPGFCECFK